MVGVLCEVGNDQGVPVLVNLCLRELEIKRV